MSALTRFAVLPLKQTVNAAARYVIYDLTTQRIVDGVYRWRALALDTAARLESAGEPVPDMTPNAEVLGLLFPTTRLQTPHTRS